MITKIIKTNYIKKVISILICFLLFASPSLYTSQDTSKKSQKPVNSLYEIMSLLESHPTFNEIRNRLESRGILLSPIISKSFPTPTSYAFEVESFNANFPTILNNEVENTKNYLICNIIRSRNSETNRLLYYFVSVVKNINQNLPIFKLSAGHKVLNIDLNSEIIFVEKIKQKDILLMDLGHILDDENDWMTCLLEYLGLSDASDIWEIINNFCNVNSQVQTVTALAIALAGCIGLSVGCPLAIAQLAIYLGCAASSIISCMEGGSPPPPSECISSISLGQTVSGSWISDCTSTHRSGRYAKYYTFSLSRTTAVQIDLQSSTDSYLYLLSGSGMNGSVITYNDDGGSGYNSRITRQLSSGTYTIEATTYSSGRTGSFSLSIASETPPPPSECISSISLGQTVSGSWISDCTSTHRSGRYAKYYTFSLSRTTAVQIDLQSSTDSYLYLLSGSGMNGSVITYNDDGGSGYNSRITRQLSSGTYTIEATTYSSGRTGSFNLTIITN